MRILMTGASGFIGRNVLAALSARGASLCALARNSQKLADLHLPIDVLQWDVAQGGKGLYARAGKPDALLHLAWGGLPCYTAARHVDEELPMQYAFLRDLIEEGLPRLVVTGTCLEYGMQSGKLSEDTQCQPTTPYGQAKHALHEKLLALQAQKPFALSWARLFYLYGDGQAERALYPQLKAAVARGEASFNMSGGQQVRDFLPIEKAAQMLAELTLAGKGAGTVNICSGVPVTVEKLVRSLLYTHGWNINLNLGHYPYPDYEPMEFWGDRSKWDRIDWREK